MADCRIFLKLRKPGEARGVWGVLKAPKLFFMLKNKVVNYLYIESVATLVVSFVPRPCLRMFGSWYESTSYLKQQIFRS